MTDTLHALAHSRRAFLRNMAILGATTAAPFAWPGMGLAQDAPKAGGTLNLVTSGDPPNFDPFSNTTSFVLHVVAACYNSLLMMHPENPDEIVGDLATGWELGADGLSYTFKLVENAKFHDGVPLTAADVKHTFDIVRDPPEGVVSSRKALLGAISGIEVIDDFTVRFDLSRPSPGLLASLATGWFVVCPKHILEAKGTMTADVIGSGPFRFKEYIPGVSYEMERNTAYHVPDRPFLDAIKYYIVPDAGTRFAYLQTGQIDHWDGLSGKDARKALAEFPDKVQIFNATSYVGDPFTMNAARKPFDDIRVRKALAYCVDHNEALKVLMDGDGVVGGMLIPGPWSISAEELAKIPGYGKDVEANRAEARKLLAEAGFPEGFETTLTARKAAGTHEDRAVFLADQFAKIGVKAKVQVQESAVYFETMKNRDFDIATNVISALSSDPDFMIGAFHTCEGALNYSAVCVPALDDLFLKQSQETDPVKRAELARQLELESLNAFGTVVLYFKGKFIATSSRVKGFVMHPEPDNNRRYQNVWLADA
jgi:peptide/nickel transport system substrate-binding protein